MENKLKELSLHLLDLGKRNRLLNYKESGYKTLSILNNNHDILFEKITSGQVLNFFNLDSVLEKYNKTIEGNDVSVLEYNGGKVFDIAKNLLRPNDILGYRKGLSLNKVLKAIYKEYTNILSEKGVNPLYLSFGLVGYFDGKQEYFAPTILIPITLFIDKGNYKIKEQEDEVILNPTLAYLLKNEYGIKLDEYNDEDFIEYVSKIKKIIENNNLKFINHVGIGIYSFLKMNMFNDLNANKDVVLTNKNVLRILGYNLENEQLNNLEIYPVVNCDNSQKEAIKYACDGASFVLQGPPGSGKSQTITNIISSMIANDKKVLFVSEKQAALNVVYENLRRAGLNDFCLALHSHKANKKEFIDDLYKTAILPQYDIQNTVEDVLLNHHYYKQSLSDYKKSINTIIDKYNMSIYDIYSRYLLLEKSPVSLQNLRVNEYYMSDLMRHKQLIDNYSNIAKIYLDDYRKSHFYGFICDDISFVRFEANKVLEQISDLVKECVLIKNKINEHLPIKVSSFSDILNNIELVNKVVCLTYYTNDYFNISKRNKLINNLNEYIEAKEYLAKSNIDKFFDLKILDVDAGYYLNSLKSYQTTFKFLKPSYHRLKKELKSYSKLKMRDYELIHKLEEVIKYSDSLEKSRVIFNELPKGYTLFDYKQIVKELVSLKEFNFDLSLNKIEFENMKRDFTDIMIEFNQLESFVKYSNYFKREIINLTDESLDVLDVKLDLMLKNIKYLDSYFKLIKVVDDLEKEDLISFVDMALDMNLDVSKLSDYYESNFLENLILYLVKENVILKEFISLDCDNIVSEFKRLDSLILETNKAMIVSKLSKMRPDDSIMAGSKFAVLVKEYNKSRKQKPIRVLLEEIKELILNIKPVFLMSPLSVSTYLSSDLDLFDVVIFDEASQVFAWDALGAIYRAKQCIIIGDSKQMPPSNFFNTVVDEEDEYTDELESILDKGTTIFNSKYLNWHYRSRCEELIAFSNEKFYEGRLITIPQAKKHKVGFGVDFTYVEGIYEAKRRVNEVEANRVVDMILDHYNSFSDYSLGVVAFSTSQADLIEEILESRLTPEIAAKMAGFVDEPFFIKNLESVQGDERDRIIFSICYGYNSEGKFYQRFGPLNNIGGERRLNVAVTRAKYNVSVVSSIKGSDISLDKTESLGVKLLKEYLDYASMIADIDYKSDLSNDGVVADIVRFLRKNGYLVHTNVGKSSFKVDVAVIDPVTKEYLTAIMVDGRSFIGNCSDSFRLQEVLLNRLGWRYYMVFSTLWIVNNSFEKEKLLMFLNSFEKSKKEDNVVSDDFLVENSDDIYDEFMEYRGLTLEEINSYSDKQKLILDIVKKEQPISVDFLLKRICHIYGRSKVTNIVRKMFLYDLDGLGLIEKDGFLMVDNLIDVPFRINSNRMIEYVHPYELKDAIYTIVKKSNGIEKDSCYKLVVKLLGYNRMSENAYGYLDNALVFLMLEGKIIEKEGRLYI